MSKAENLKEKGNAAFGKKDYTEAIEWYTCAITVGVVEDKSLAKGKSMKHVYYANRAQAYLCDLQFKEALDDCDVAI